MATTQITALFGEKELKITDTTKLSKLCLTRHNLGGKVYYLFRGDLWTFRNLPKSNPQ